MKSPKPIPFHINATQEDLEGNTSGRYILLCGSRKRSQDIAEQFDHLVVKDHPRGHDLYLGSIKCEKHSIDVAVIATGMGCPSVDIIFNELLLLGGRNYLRIGTAGSLQPHRVKAGDVVIPTAAVRDESTSQNYIDLSYPAVASLHMVNSAIQAATQLGLQQNTFVGIIHTKDSLYAREFRFSRCKQNLEYMKNLRNAGVLATEMECSLIFTLAQLQSEAVKVGAVLAIVGDTTPIGYEDMVKLAEERAIAIGLETIRQLYRNKK